MAGFEHGEFRLPNNVQSSRDSVYKGLLFGATFGAATPAGSSAHTVAGAEGVFIDKSLMGIVGVTPSAATITVVNFFPRGGTIKIANTLAELTTSRLEIPDGGGYSKKAFVRPALKDSDALCFFDVISGTPVLDYEIHYF